MLRASARTRWAIAAAPSVPVKFLRLWPHHGFHALSHAHPPRPPFATGLLLWDHHDTPHSFSRYRSVLMRRLSDRPEIRNTTHSDERFVNRPAPGCKSALAALRRQRCGGGAGPWPSACRRGCRARYPKIRGRGKPPMKRRNLARLLDLESIARWCLNLYRPPLFWGSIAGCVNLYISRLRALSRR